MKKPYSKFFWSDWRNEMTLRLCSLAARGLWMEMLSIMGISEKIGYLQIGGKPITVEQIAIMSGISKEDAEKYIAELEGNGVFSRDEYGVIYSRRMVREAIKFEEAQKNGRKGGNPKLIPESRIQNPEAKSKKLEATEGIREGVKGADKGKLKNEYESDFEDFWRTYPKKKAKGYALKAYRKALAKTTAEVMLNALNTQKKSKEWTKDSGQFIPYPATWLNGECWNDDDGIKPASKPSKAKGEAIYDC